MTLKHELQQDPARACSPTDSVLAVQPVNGRCAIPVDGPAVQMNNNMSTKPDRPHSKAGSPSACEMTILASRFQSAKSGPSPEHGISNHEQLCESSLETLNDTADADKVGIQETQSDGKFTTTAVSDEDSALEADVDQSRVVVVTQRSDAIEPAAVAESSQMTRSVPPHLRIGTCSSAAPLPHDGGPKKLVEERMPKTWPLPGPRVSRSYYNGGGSYHYSDGGKEVARVNAQMMKMRNELEAERTKNTNMHAAIKDALTQKMDKALASMTMDLVKKQAETLEQQTKVEAMVRDMAYREKGIKQMEVWLSAGQKVLHSRRSHRGDEEEEKEEEEEEKEEDAAGDMTMTMATVNREHSRQQADLLTQKRMTEREAAVTARLQAIEMRESAQVMREQQYKMLFHSANAAMMPNMDAKREQVGGEREYSRGFDAGKMAAGAEHVDKKEAREQGFLEGYAACQRHQVALSKLRQQSMIAHGDAAAAAELDFIFDAASPHNLFAMGMRIGCEEGKGKDKDKDKGKARVQDVPLAPVVRSSGSSIAVSVGQPLSRPTFAAELRDAANRVYEGRKVVKYDEAQDESLIDLD
ncbi:hypothetical protein ACEQ8H_007577 [Pleosporales sp. CAS-2024a]